MIERLYTHIVNVYRPTSSVLDGVTTLYTHAVNQTYTQPILLEFVIPSGSASFTVTGQLNGLTTTSTVVFSTGGTILKKQTDKLFDNVISIVGTTGTASSVTVKTINKSGQPFFTDEAIYTGLRCRIDNVGYGNPATLQVGVRRPDSLLCFVGSDQAAEGTIKVDDKITQTGLLDETQSGRVATYDFQVKNIDSYYNRYNYIYSELTLAKID